MLATNEVLQQNRYRIIHHLGEDLTGTVYEAYDNVLETNVVLKEIKINLDKVSTVTQQEKRNLAFANEAKMLTEINHESLLHVHDYFSEIDYQYLVMESVSGRNLHELIDESKKPIALSELTDWADQLLDALYCLHTRIPPIIHGDIKPQNVRLTSNGKIKLPAPGLAKNPETKTNSLGRNRVNLASELNFVPLEQIWEGLDYASQKVILKNYDEKSEKVLQQPIDTRSDIYAIGALLYYLATAQRPIDALERSIDILEGKADPLPSPDQLNPAIPPEVSEILMRALEIKRENRFGAAVIMRQMLKTALVRAKERETSKTKPANETNISNQTISETERQTAGLKELEQQQIAAQRKLDIEADQKRQKELIAQKLREAEEQRLKTERRAAAVEKLLMEEEVIPLEAVEIIKEEVINIDHSDILELGKTDLEEAVPAVTVPVTVVAAPQEPIAPAPAKSPETVVQMKATDKPVPEKTAPDADKKVAAEDTQPTVEFKELFAQPEKDKSVFKRMAAAAVLLLTLGGAGFGVWSMMSSKPGEPSQTVSSGAAVNRSVAVEATPAPTVQTTSETTAADMPAAVEEADVQNPDGSTDQKSKAFSQSTKAKRQPLPSARTPAAQKKAVTVEDIINDN